ncbi:putative baseplate assembly protein [Bradyrhizobium sp. JYMT SZCCT0180]|uniref:putative baseplate assembly protein n=1 Tax=Bradyrhizobium sp. JYMT SZCCT0180 TaxID=2807666 RepID=UPI001BA51FA4|nr:putative baseplate assembly protein [Bradyrhizobium sp. JYMT SZCCT0180]
MAEQQPLIDYMAKDYESFRRLMLDRLSATLPGWQERHAPDLGIALVEALAYVADYLSYYQDAVATEAYLGTARQRISVRRHARLLDYVLHEGCNARAWIHCEVQGGGKVSLDPHGVMFVAIGDRAGAELPLLTESDLTVLPETSFEIFQPVGSEKISLDSGLNEIAITGKFEEGATDGEVTLADGLVLKPGTVLILKGTTAGAGGNSSDARYHAVALTGCRAARGKSATHSITWDIDDAIPASMAGLNKFVALGNIVLVDHGRSVSEGGPNLTVKAGAAGPLSRRGLTHRVPPQTTANSAAAMVVQNPHEAMPAVALAIEEEPWGRVKADLLESLPTDRHFCVEVDDGGRAWIRFGDGAGVGESPPDGTNFVATYRIGNGAAGNVSAGAIRRVILKNGAASSGINNIAVTNPMSAVGGTEPESTATARLLAPGDMRVHQHRAISADDYAEFARGVSGVANAVATIMQEGTRRVVRVAIDPKGEQAPNQTSDPKAWARWKALKERVLQRLGGVRRINHDVIVAAPDYVDLTIRLKVTLLPSYLKDTVVAQVKREFIDDKGKSFFDPDKLTFGQSIYWSQVASLLHAIPGIASVEQVEFARKDRLPRNDATPSPTDKIEIGPKEIAVLKPSDLDVTPIETVGP